MCANWISAAISGSMALFWGTCCETTLYDALGRIVFCGYGATCAIGAFTITLDKRFKISASEQSFTIGITLLGIGTATTSPSKKRK